MLAPHELERAIGGGGGWKGEVEGGELAREEKGRDRTGEER